MCGREGRLVVGENPVFINRVSPWSHCWCKHGRECILSGHRVQDIYGHQDKVGEITGQYLAINGVPRPVLRHKE